MFYKEWVSKQLFHSLCFKTLINFKFSIVQIREPSSKGFNYTYLVVAISS